MEKIIDKIKHCCHEREEAFCASSCPFHLDVRDFISKMQRGGFNAAFRTFSNAVGFPGIVSALCGEPCRAACALNDEAISLNMLERAAMRFASNTKPNSYNMPTKGARIAIVGAGISGLACALRLCNRKYSVTVFEASNRIGGHLWDVMPSGDFLSDIEKQFMYEEYELKFGTTIKSADELAGFDAVYAAVGRDVPRDFAGRGGYFIGGSSRGSATMEAIYDGLTACGLIEAWLKTGNMSDFPVHAPTQMILDESAIVSSKRVAPADGSEYTKDEAAAEAKRCIKCRCDACVRNCAMMDLFRKFPKRIEEEVHITLNPGTLDGNGTAATRLISTCNQCGLCKEVCPEHIDMGVFLRKAHQAMHEKDAMPWAFHEFWLRDMEFANGDRASCTIDGASEKPSILFFPGCQMGASDPRYVTESYKYLLSLYPDAAIKLGCCGAPALWAGDAALHRSVCDGILSDWHRLGEPKLVFGCPTCRLMFAESMPEIKGVMLYDIMAEKSADAAPLAGAGQRVSVFDACAARDYPETRQSVRAVVERAGYTIEPLPYEGARAQCCSWGGQISTASPAYTKLLVDKRKSESELPYVVYCTNCRDIFADAGKPVLHVLDILFGFEPRGLPTVSERRRNRELLKRELTSADAPRESGINLVMTPEVAAKLNKDRILEEDVVEVLEFCEHSGRMTKDAATGHLFGCKKIGHMTLWAEFTRNDDGYELHSAYSHRMKIEVEEVWHGRKQNADM